MNVTPDVQDAFKKFFADFIEKHKGEKTPVDELPQRTGIVYKDNAGYNLTVNNLPWAKGTFTIKRYRISKTQNLDLVEEKTASGGSLRLSNAFAPDTVELIVLQGK